MSNNNNDKRILLVDDEPDIGLSFKIALEDNGFAVDVFDDPEKASTNFKSDSYDLLLLDIKMPNLDGIEFYKRMKEIDNKVKVCFITASEIHYHEKIAKQLLPLLGARCLFRKPIKIGVLVNSLKKELGLTRDSDHGNNEPQPHCL